jgi:hypothetical protein
MHGRYQGSLGICSPFQPRLVETFSHGNVLASASGSRTSAAWCEFVAPDILFADDQLPAGGGPRVRQEAPPRVIRSLLHRRT